MRPMTCSGLALPAVLLLLLFPANGHARKQDRERARTSRQRLRNSEERVDVRRTGRLLLPVDNTTLAEQALEEDTRPDEQGDLQVGCQELRSKRYISDGFCTSITPITEVVCTGHCLPIGELPWYAEFIKVWATTKVLEWRCVEDVVKRKKVTLMCETGEKRTYRIKVVKSCKCKRYMRQQNQSVSGRSRRKRKRHHRRRDRRKDIDSDNTGPRDGL